MPPEILEVADARGDNQVISVDLFKCDLYSTGLLIIVCCGLREKKLGTIDKDEEKEHNEKIDEFLKMFVAPKLPEIVELIRKMTQFERGKRYDMKDVWAYCEKFKIFEKNQKVNSIYSFSLKTLKLNKYRKIQSLINLEITKIKRIK